MRANRRFISRSVTTRATLAAGIAILAIGGSGLSATRGGNEPSPSIVQGRDTACVQLMRFLRPEPMGDSAQRLLARHCVFATDSARRDESEGLLLRDDLRLARTYSSIPEYHDEQRLSIGGGALGPMAGIYASPNLDDFTEEWQFWEHGTRGVFVAHVVVQLRAGETLPLPGSYTELGLAEGLNCVWLVKVNAGSRWEARVIPANGLICDPNYTPTGWTAPTLTVNRLAPTAWNSLSNYPPVARFDESRNDKPLLSVRCLTGICEIGYRTFTSRMPLAVMKGATGLRAEVKGWHDEQPLTEFNTASGRWVASGLRAALVPTNITGHLQTDDFRAGWKHVATLYLDRRPAPNTKYAHWGLDDGPNEIFLRINAGGNWEAELRRTGYRRPWTFIHREQHFDVGVPATVRFRWTILDDGIWAPCGMSCCQVEG